MKTLDLNPFFFEGGEVGCLLVHGFSGSPPEMRPMGEYLAGKGLQWTWPAPAGATGSPRPRRDCESCNGAASGSLLLASLWVD